MTEDKDPFDGYGYAIRTFWFDAEALKVFRGWGDENEAKIEKRIQGDGIAELDSVHIIGTNTKTSRFDVSIRSNEMAAEEWKRAKSDYIAIRGADGIGENKVTKYLDIINQHCDEKPPTANLGYTETDEEIGITAGWWCQIMVPNVVLEQLEQDIASGMVNKISIGIEWIGGLVFDKYAPPAAHNIWGLLSTQDDSSPVCKACCGPDDAINRASADGSPDKARSTRLSNATSLAAAAFLLRTASEVGRPPRLPV
jgi:hypothetical protein